MVTERWNLYAVDASSISSLKKHSQRILAKSYILPTPVDRPHSAAGKKRRRVLIPSYTQAIPTRIY